MVQAAQHRHFLEEVLLGFFVHPVEFFQHHHFGSVSRGDLEHLPEETLTEQFAFDEIRGAKNALGGTLLEERVGSGQFQAAFGGGGAWELREKIENRVKRWFNQSNSGVNLRKPDLLSRLIRARSNIKNKQK